ncbi:unnamed protein product [Parascedosporium putredinis]|uniref:Uncharacterized protein n=1 Tax=Parascedosporium putredinis TaxID=1442378 RepID=A0A9P1H0B4_9PEZI|nr:unnamed protein product [Parascedosporium putredinis]CAI7991631.1 unnamed protein product [Parascedosporium putredinis]
MEAWRREMRAKELTRRRRAGSGSAAAAARVMETIEEEEQGRGDGEVHAYGDDDDDDDDGRGGPDSRRTTVSCSTATTVFSNITGPRTSLSARTSMSSWTSDPGPEEPEADTAYRLAWMWVKGWRSRLTVAGTRWSRVVAPARGDGQHRIPRESEMGSSHEYPSNAFFSTPDTSFPNIERVERPNWLEQPQLNRHDDHGVIIGGHQRGLNSLVPSARGLFRQHEPCQVNIIFVHGIEGTSHDTWRIDALTNETDSTYHAGAPICGGGHNCSTTTLLVRKYGCMDTTLAFERACFSAERKM